MWSAGVVVVDPAGEGAGAFGAGGVDAAVVPAGDEGADEPLGFAIGAGSVGLGAQMADGQRGAREGVQARAVGRAVIGHHALPRPPPPAINPPPTPVLANNNRLCGHVLALLCNVTVRCPPWTG